MPDKDLVSLGNKSFENLKKINLKSGFGYNPTGGLRMPLWYLASCSR